MGGLYPHLFPAAGPAGDAVLIKFQNPDLGLSPAQIAEMRLAYGADSPLWRQYLHTLLAMLHGDFGYSLQAGLAVSSLIASNLPDTLSLALPAFLLAVALAFALAFASRLPGLRWLSNFLQSLPVLFISTYLLVGYRPDPALLVSVALDPGNQPRPTGRTDFTGYRRRTAHFRPTGADPDAQHGSGGGSALRRGRPRQGHERNGRPLAPCDGNALLPALNIAGLLLGELIAGALITETVFGRSGLGQLTQQAVNNRISPYYRRW